MAHLENAQAIGNRCINIHGFTRYTPAFVGWHRIQRAHIVQAVGELNDNDPNILYHCQHHFAEIFGLRLGLGAEVDLGELADSVNQFGHFFTELLDQIFLQGWCVFDHIVQYCGNDAVGIHAHFAENSGHGDWMADIRLTGNATLPFVCACT